MKRRDFHAFAAGTAATASGLFSPEVVALGGPPDPAEFRRLPKNVPASTPGTIEVIAFFWYGCRYCHVFDPVIESWAAAKGRPADVEYLKVPVVFRKHMEVHRQLFYALEALGEGREASLRERVFMALQDRPDSLSSIDDIVAFLTSAQRETGSDALAPSRFKQVYGSFGVATRIRKAAILQTQYDVDSVPVVAIGGRFMTGPSMTGGGPRCLEVIDHLVALARKDASGHA